MRLICCCSQLRSKAAPTGGEQPLDTSPSSRPAARLPRLSVTDMAAHSLVSTPDRSSLTDPLPGASVAALVQPGVLVADESDDEDGEQTNLESSKINPLSVLEAVKTRIRRHLSQDRLFCQNETREQSAHRAEVKRLMHKRIRDELQTDSSEAVAETSTPPRVICRIATPLSNGPRDTIEFTMESNTERGLTATKALCHSLGSAEGEDQASSKAVMNQTSAQSAQEDGSPAVARALDLQCLSISAPTTLPVEKGHMHLKQHSSLSDISASPLRCPVSAASPPDGSSLASWRLSLEMDRLVDFRSPREHSRLIGQSVLYASPSQSTYNVEATLARLGGHLRSSSVPSTLHGSTLMRGLNASQTSLASSNHAQIPPSMSLLRAESPVGLWLRTQTQQFRCSTLSQLPNDELSGSVTTANTSKDAAEVVVPDVLAPRHYVREHQLASPEEPQHTLRTVHAAVPASAEACQRVLLSHHDRPTLLVLDGGCTSQGSQKDSCEEHSVMQPISHSSPSRSAMATVLLKHKTKPAVHRIMERGLTGLKATFSRVNEPPCVDDSTVIKMVPRSLGTSTSFSSLVTPRARDLTMDSESDASSYCRREVEFQAVDERFQHSHLRQVARAPVASKFCEVLNGQGEAGMEKSLKPLMISNSHLSIGMEAYHVDGHGTDIPRDQQHAEDGLSRDNLEVPAKNHVYSLSAHETSLSHFDKSVIPRRRRGFSSSEDGDETAEIWKRALEADSMARCGRRSVSNHTTVAQYELRQGRGHDQALPALKIDAPRTQTSSNSQEHSLTSNAVVKQEDDEVFRRSLEKSNNMLEDWSRQLNSPRPALGRENFALPSLCQPFIMTRRTPPASWSGFPSESRAARNAMAGEVDQVKSRDFAVVGLSHLGETIWITDKSSAHPKLRTNTRSFSDRFTQPFQKLGLSRLWAGRPRTPPKDKSIRGARRSSIRTSSDLEYPELEILPNVGGYEELRVIKEELNELRGLYTAAQSIPDPETVTLTRASLPKPLMPSLTQQDCSHEVEVPKAADVFAYRGTDASHPIFDFGCTSAPTIEIADPGITHCSSSSSQPFHSLQSSASSPRSLTPQSVLRRGMAVSHSKVTFDGGTLRNGTIPSLHTAATARGRRWDMWADEFNCRPASSQSSPY